ncbi:polymerase [Acidovorax phage AP1]|nr:polymerase [Acidovorax phage AP1]
MRPQPGRRLSDRAHFPCSKSWSNRPRWVAKKLQFFTAAPSSACRWPVFSRLQ